MIQDDPMIKYNVVKRGVVAVFSMSIILVGLASSGNTCNIHQNIAYHINQCAFASRLH